ncbi:unnamed protein product [Lepeophtheirus salmonis]|uniref:(salmon louse) hypothetical protein n=2 Tax=Lepeophtheirus salmonis TaxID=72036 RepID=A0A7R8GZA9_LEPSM|nr:unnamed protein product [Lepeophtheirus salmonis]CAF2750963.1 unnamed protein product [Lepeophtheirus salmonis]
MEPIDTDVAGMLEDNKLMRAIKEDPKSIEEILSRKRRDDEDSKEEEVDCSWNIKTEESLYLLVTFHNLSAPFTVDCEGAYIEVERENNGFDARWCGNRVLQGGTSPHVIFAKSEVRITVFDDGNGGKTFPTGFSADVEVIDLFDGEHQHVRSEAYSNVKKLVG